MKLRNGDIWHREMEIEADTGHGDKVISCRDWIERSKEMNKKEAVSKLRKIMDEVSKDDWGLFIIHSPEGFVVRTLPDGNIEPFATKDAYADDAGSHVSSAQELLWFILEYFAVNPSRHSKYVLSVIKEMGEKYFLKKGEKLKKNFYYTVVDKEKKDD